MLNAARSPTFYEFDSGEYFRVWREMDDSDEEAVVIYHSHTATEAYPSRTDISYAGWPEAHYVLVSTRDEQEAEFRSYRIVDGQVTEEPVDITQLSSRGSESRPPDGTNFPGWPRTWNDRVSLKVPTKAVRGH
jgi:proteasome lid subunit RPN8/RPN11